MSRFACSPLLLLLGRSAQRLLGPAAESSR